MARDALRTTSIFRFRTLENNLNFLIISKHVKNDMWLKLIYMYVNKYNIRIIAWTYQIY